MEVAVELHMKDISQEVMKDTPLHELKLTTKFQNNPILHFGIDIDSAFFSQKWIWENHVTRWKETFYDTEDFVLTKNNCWLKLRDHQYSLKIVLGYENESLICGEFHLIEDIERYLKEHFNTQLSNCTTEIGTLACSRSQISIDDGQTNIYVDSCQMNELDYYIVCAVRSPTTKALASTIQKFLSCSTVLKPVPSKIIEFILCHKSELMPITDNNIKQLDATFDSNRKFFHRLCDPFAALSPFANCEETTLWFKTKELNILPSTAAEMYAATLENLVKNYQMDVASLIYYYLHCWEAGTSFDYDADEFVHKYRTNPGAVKELAAMKELELEPLYCYSMLPEASQRLSHLLKLYGTMRTHLGIHGILW